MELGVKYEKKVAIPAADGSTFAVTFICRVEYREGGEGNEGNVVENKRYSVDLHGTEVDISFAEDGVQIEPWLVLGYVDELWHYRRELMGDGWEDTVRRLLFRLDYEDDVIDKFPRPLVDKMREYYGSDPAQW